MMWMLWSTLYTTGALGPEALVALRNVSEQCIPQCDKQSMLISSLLKLMTLEIYIKLFLLKSIYNSFIHIILTCRSDSEGPSCIFKVSLL